METLLEVWAETGTRSLLPIGQSKSCGSNNTFYHSYCVSGIFKQECLFKRGYLFLMPLIFLSHVSLYLEELKLKVSCSYPWPDSLSLISKMIPELPSLPLSKTQNSSCPFLAQKHVNESLFPTDIAQILGWLHNILYNILTFSSIGLWQTVFSLSHLPGECLFICPRAAETTTSTHPSLVPWRLCCFLICVFLARGEHN